VDFTDESSVKGTGDGNNRRSVDTVFHESERRSKPGLAKGTAPSYGPSSATQTVSAGRLGLYTPGWRRRESGALFALIARLAAQTAGNNIMMQATVVTMVASSVSA
jgi:hypothetical protein